MQEQSGEPKRIAPKTILMSEEDSLAELADLICEILAVCYSDAHKPSLTEDAKKMGGDLDRMVAATVAWRISKAFEFRHKRTRRLKNN